MGFFIMSTSLMNATQGYGLNWVYQQYLRKNAQALLAFPLLGTPHPLSNDPIPLTKERHYLVGWSPGV